MIDRFDPSAEFARLQTEFKRLFGECPEVPVGPGGQLRRATWSPLIDIEETPAAFVLRADLPSVRRQDVQLSLDGRTVVLSGERRFGQEEKRDRFVRLERTYGTFARSITLPTEVDPARVTARFAHGVLTVTLPKRRAVRGTAPSSHRRRVAA